ncbi:hypothetical protein [Nostoc sp. 'Peltigera membranacea cyanobiont' 232]|uniref:hypothetical protein n=1 Tax=Nostoc sp. 'Peltigera membranacea cyanobiont' 232 TaxID=2014531 RepID=UPI000B951E62|nr:hypothetical protein [Nostoc sp. 'Peltigera membranacea cyanobiont' 232]OYE02131.1 hypothetical protein CDG79_25520 [Nostoc sp. 'Peltigera membranacea cyanobiont' 232]
MTNLVAYNNDGLEIYIDNITGEAFASISSYARMSGLSQQAISKRVKAHNFKEIKTAEIQTRGGTQAHNLLTESIIAEWIIRDNPDVAIQFAKLGIRKFMHTLAGYSQVQEKPINSLTLIDTSKLDALNAKEGKLQDEVRTLEIRLASIRNELQGIRIEEVAIAKALVASHPDVVKHAIKCSEILEAYGDGNKYFSNPLKK